MQRQKLFQTIKRGKKFEKYEFSILSGKSIILFLDVVQTMDGRDEP